MKEVETERLKLRNWTLSDYKDMYEYARNPLVGPNAGWKPHKDENESKKIISMFIEDNDVLAIELKTIKKIIGSIGLHKQNPDKNINILEQREIGYVLNPDYWGKGYMPEAVNGLLAFGFNDLGLKLIWCGHYEDNYKSKRVVEKCGFNFKFKKEEMIPLLDNLMVCTYYYNMTKEEYWKN